VEQLKQIIKFEDREVKSPFSKGLTKEINKTLEMGRKLKEFNEKQLEKVNGTRL